MVIDSRRSCVMTTSEPRALPHRVRSTSFVCLNRLCDSHSVRPGIPNRDKQYQSMREQLDAHCSPCCESSRSHTRGRDVSKSPTLRHHGNSGLHTLAHSADVARDQTIGLGWRTTTKPWARFPFCTTPLTSNADRSDIVYSSLPYEKLALIITQRNWSLKTLSQPMRRRVTTGSVLHRRTRAEGDGSKLAGG